VLGFYIVFQGVVLTAVAQASALQCSQWWSPFTLSLIASIVTIVGVYQKLQVLHDVEQNLREERNSFQVLAA
jgi:membrane protein implicated in regulation of membrane protease activity